MVILAIMPHKKEEEDESESLWNYLRDVGGNDCREEI